MEDSWARSLPLLGEEGLLRLQRAHVAVIGLGGVGGHAAEALARAGVGALTLFDGDEVALSNLNRQIFATRSTVGMRKVKAAEMRIRDIAADCRIQTQDVVLTPENIGEYDFSPFDFVIDAIDDVPAKIAVITAAKTALVPVISSMGTGNKLDPSLFSIADIEKTSVCPLARKMRRELRLRGVRDVPVLFSKELPHASAEEDGRHVPASVSFVPSVAGLLIAGDVVLRLAGLK